MTIAVAILISGVISLTLTPMLSSRFLRPPRHGGRRLYQLSERGFEAMRRAYERTLDWSLLRRGIVFASFVGTLVLTG